jgi:hypothetical protein
MLLGTVLVANAVALQTASRKRRVQRHRLAGGDGLRSPLKESYCPWRSYVDAVRIVAASMERVNENLRVFPVTKPATRALSSTALVGFQHGADQQLGVSKSMLLDC